jgi:hypothetical protein
MLGMLSKFAFNILCGRSLLSQRRGGASINIIAVRGRLRGSVVPVGSFGSHLPRSFGSTLRDIDDAGDDDTIRRLGKNNCIRDLFNILAVLVCFIVPFCFRYGNICIE